MFVSPSASRLSPLAETVPWSLLLLTMAVICWAPSLTRAADSGAQLYKLQCAACHGANGEGVEDYCPDPLHGDRSLEDLAKVIHETMPEDDPEKCAGSDARAVAEYIFGAFYTEEARARNRPARIELSRLTVRQYHNAVADLVGEFVGEGQPGDARGIQARYYNAKHFRNDKKVIDRIDAQVAFDFQDKTPDPDKIQGEEFSIQWQGGIVAETTGDYEFCLKTENAARLWVNDPETPLIDAWVKSGDETEYRGTVRLLGGRVYPLRIDYFKSKEKTASIVLLWQPPHRVEQTVPERSLSPDRFPPVAIVETDFPPDDSSVGYVRGTTVSKSWDQATTYAAIEVANHVAGNLESVAKCKPDAPDRQKRLREFCHRFAERAFRRPLDEQQKRFYVDTHFEDGEDVEAAVKRVVLLVLKSPRFLYLGIGDSGKNDFGVASRLSFGLWDSLPDQELLKAAAAGKLHSPEDVERQARRMLPDPRTRSKLKDFFHKWLNVERCYDLSKDQELYPDFDQAVLSDALTSLDLFVDDVVWGESSDFRQLLLADHLYVNQRLADFYGMAAPSDAEFHKVVVDPVERAGVLTHPVTLTGLAYHKSSSPIHRGVFIVRSVLGRSLKPPPIAVAPLDEGLDPDMTTRERVTLQTKPNLCQTCHSMINPLGFSLENFDAVGRYRLEEGPKKIDASGVYTSRKGDKTRFEGARELAEFLAESDETHRTFVEQLFHECVKQPISAYGPEQLRQLESTFAGSQYSIQQLLVEIMKASVLTAK